MKYKCNECDYQATEKGSLKKHNKSIHQGIKYNAMNVITKQQKM